MGLQRASPSDDGSCDLDSCNWCEDESACNCAGQACLGMKTLHFVNILEKSATATATSLTSAASVAVMASLWATATAMATKTPSACVVAIAAGADTDGIWRR